MAGASGGRLGRWLRLAALLCGANLLVEAVRALRDLSETDYVIFAAAARLLHAGTRGLYRLPPYRAAEAALIGYTPNNPSFPDAYLNPPLAAWLLQPVAVLPPQVGLAVFAALGLLAVAAATVCLLRLLPRPLPPLAVAVAVLAVANLPGALGFALAQWDPLLLLAGAAGLLLLQRGHGLAAGLLLSVLLVKPQIAWLLLPVLLLAGARRVAAGFTAGAAVWLGTTVALTGASGLPDWLHTLATHRPWEMAQAISIPGWVAHAGAGSSGVFAAAAVGASVGLVVAATGARRRLLRDDPLLAVGVAVALALAVSPHAWDHDLLLLALPLVALLRRSFGWALAGVAAVDGLFLLDQLVPASLPRLQALSAPLLIAAIFVHNAQFGEHLAAHVPVLRRERRRTRQQPAS